MIGTNLIHYLRHLLLVSLAHGLWMMWHMCMDILIVVHLVEVWCMVDSLSMVQVVIHVWCMVEALIDDLDMCLV
jgi:hypothetical protein